MVQSLTLLCVLKLTDKVSHEGDREVLSMVRHQGAHMRKGSRSEHRPLPLCRQVLHTSNKVPHEGNREVSAMEGHQGPSMCRGTNARPDANRSGRGRLVAFRKIRNVHMIGFYAFINRSLILNRVKVRCQVIFFYYDRQIQKLKLSHF